MIGHLNSLKLIIAGKKMRSSEYYYGKYYNKEVVKFHLAPFYLKILWAKDLIDDLMLEPIETRDFKRINDCMQAIKFNQRIIDEAFDRDEME